MKANGGLLRISEDVELEMKVRFGLIVLKNSVSSEIR